MNNCKSCGLILHYKRTVVEYYNKGKTTEDVVKYLEEFCLEVCCIRDYIGLDDLKHYNKTKKLIPNILQTLFTHDMISEIVISEHKEGLNRNKK